MLNEYASFLIGTIGLWILFGVSWAVILGRPRSQRWKFQSVKKPVAIALGLHTLHVGEEAHFAFYISFPAFLGFDPWPYWLFLSFNVTLIVIWIYGFHFTMQGRSYAALYLFFALASITNSIVHPALSVAVSGYFPGLVTSPFVGVLGVILLRRLWYEFDGTPQTAPGGQFERTH